MAIQKSHPRTVAIRGAVRAWRAGKPHRALEIITDAGYRDMWPEFQRRALADARARYLARIAAHSR